jgi:two-component system CheB/CheR fusion protein
MSDAIETVLSRPVTLSGATDSDLTPLGTAQIGAEKVFVVDDDYFCREALSGLLQDQGWEVETFSSCEAFLSVHEPHPNTCILLDVHFPGMTGLDLLDQVEAQAPSPPVIVVSGSSGITEAVQSMKRGALDFLQKPVVAEVLVASVQRALAQSRRTFEDATSRAAALGRLRGLTARQRQIMAMVLAGRPNKNIATDLGISQRTVENHRASIMHRTGARSLAALVQLAMGEGCLADR